MNKVLSTIRGSRSIINTRSIVNARSIINAQPIVNTRAMSNTYNNKNVTDHKLRCAPIKNRLGSSSYYVLGAGCLLLGGFVYAQSKQSKNMSLIAICTDSNYDIDKINKQVGNRLRKRYEPNSELQELLRWCAEKHHTDIIIFVLKQNSFYTNDFMCEDVLLHNAEWGNKSVIKFMLNEGAIAAIHGGAALVSSIEWGNSSIMSLLINEGANVNVYGGLPLRAAIKKYNTWYMEQLLDNGAHVSFNSSMVKKLAKDKSWRTLTLLLKYKDRLDDGDYKHMIECAVNDGNLSMVELLVSKFIDVDHYDLLRRSIYDKNFGIAKILVQNAINLKGPNSNICKQLKAGGNDILEPCVERGNLHMVKLLVENGCVIRDNVMVVGAKAGNLTVMRYLIEKGANCNARNNYSNNSALSESIKAKHYDVAKFLIEGGAKIDPKDPALRDIMPIVNLIVANRQSLVH